MAKNSAREILGILRQFEVAGILTVPKEITHIQESEPKANVRVIACIFENKHYYVIIDNTANDNTAALKEYIHAKKPDVAGRFLKNPHEDSFTTYGIRHKFRDTYVYEVQPTTRRLDIELSSRYSELSRSTIQKYIKAGYVQVNGVVVTKTKHEVSDADILSMEIKEKEDFSHKELPIVYIDDHVIVVNKPSGVLTHSKGVMNDEFTVADFFRRYTHHGLHTNRPGIVHRLDRDTSGLIIGARDDETAALLKKQFADRTVHKEYLAVVKGVPKELHAKIDLPIGRNPSAPSTFRVDPSGKPAVTIYEVMAATPTQSLVLLKPETGRTHQLRVHLSYINTPILGDRVYGTKKTDERLSLHALRLEITIPPSRRHTFHAPAPDSFVALFPEAKDV